MDEFLNYYTTGTVAVLETVMIFFLVGFLGWNIKLYLEVESSEE